jgi:tetratricopeptide (TPR) repeat protein
VYYEVAVVVSFAAGATFSILAFSENLQDNKWFLRIGLIVWVLAYGNLLFEAARAGSAGGQTAIVVVVTVGAGAVFWAPFLVICIVRTFGRLGGWAVGLGNLRVPPSFSHAEAAEARGDLEEAEAAYRFALQEYPKAPVAFRKFADFLVKIGRPMEAREYYEKASRLDDDFSARLTDRFAVADILAEDAGDLPGAIAYLERFAASEPDTRAAAYAAERIAQYRRRMAT